MNDRWSKDEAMMAMALAAAQRGTCDRRLVGCVLATEKGRVLSTGYNGAPAGCPHCDEVGHLMHNGSCMRTVHAEVNAVGYPARHGGPALDRCTAYCTCHPCPSCLMLLITAGCRRILYAQEYHSDLAEVTRGITEPAAAHLGLVIERFPLDLSSLTLRRLSQ